MQTSLSHHYQFLLIKLLFCLLFIALLRRKLCALKRCVSSSLELHQNYSFVLQRHAGQTAVLQVLTLGHMRSNDYSTTEISVYNFLLSIMSTNRFSPTVVIKNPPKKSWPNSPFGLWPPNHPHTLIGFITVSSPPISWCVVSILAQCGCRRIIQMDAAHWWWMRRYPLLCKALYKCNKLL